MKTSDDRYGWDCAIGSLLSKGGKVAKKGQYVPEYHTYQWLVYDEAGNEVGTIYARPDDWIGEDRIKLIDGEQND